LNKKRAELLKLENQYAANIQVEGRQDITPGEGQLKFSQIEAGD
jgi:hypothetical protein